MAPVLSSTKWKSVKKCEKSETILPFSCCPFIFSLSKTYRGEEGLIKTVGPPSLQSCSSEKTLSVALWKMSIEDFSTACCMQTRCIVEGEAQKSPLFWRFSGGFRFFQERLFSRNSTRKPLKFNRFLQTPLVNPLFLYNAPSVHTVDFFVFSVAAIFPGN